MPNERSDRFEIEYDAFTKIAALNDKREQVIIVITLEQIEQLLEWYCDTFKKIVI